MMLIEIKNAWILTAIFLTVSYLPLIFHSKGRKRLSDFSWINKQGKYLSLAILLVFIIYLVLACFYNITINEVPKYIGLLLFLVGNIGVLISYHNYFTTNNDVLITKGLYQISRNPIYVSSLIVFLGMAILCMSNIMFLVLLLYPVLQHPIIKEEERFCKHKYGKEYDKYVKKVRRYL